MRRRTLAVLVVWMALVALSTKPAPAADRGPDGTLIESKRYDLPAFTALPKWAQDAWGRETYERLLSGRDAELLRISYWSGGLKVIGFIFKPVNTAGKTFPVVLWSRGGIGEEARIGGSNMFPVYEMHRYVQAGFVVLAAQYRGIDGGEGTDQVGGGDVDDLLNLVPLARSLPYADASRFYAYGLSRGGLMTLQAIRRGLPVKAAAVVGPVTDFAGLLPRLEQTMKSAVPGWERNRDREVEARSPVRWAGSLTGVPLLLIHGGADEAVPVAQTLAFAQRFGAAGGVYELIVYAKDDHPVSNHLEERLRRTIEWFRNPPSK